MRATTLSVWFISVSQQLEQDLGNIRINICWMDDWVEQWRDMAKIFTLAFGIVIMAGSGIPPQCESACRLQGNGSLE